MNRTEAKEISLKIVRKWRQVYRPDLTIAGTVTGRMSCVGRNYIGANRNGDHILPFLLEMDQAEVERRVLVYMHRYPEVAAFMSREQADRFERARFERARFDYARADAEITALMAISMEHGVPIVTSVQQQPVLRRDE